MMKMNFQMVFFPFLIFFIVLHEQTIFPSCSAQHEKSSEIPSPIYNFPASPASTTTTTSTTTQKPQKYVALTFDDGPHEFLTPDLLTALQLADIKVTFFVMGIKVIMHPSIVSRAYREGHEIANHVWNHPVLSKISWQEVDHQLTMTSQAIFNVTGEYPKVMRPPYGNTNRKLNHHIAKDEKYPIIMWSLDTNDWRRPGAAEIVKRVLAKVEDGTIILCHDIHPGTIEAIPTIIKELHSRGYQFKTISQLIEMHYLSTKK